MALINNGKFIGGKPPSGFNYPYTIPYSMKIPLVTDYLTRTVSVDADNNYIWTLSFWWKWGETTAAQNLGIVTGGADSSNRGVIFLDSSSNKITLFRNNVGSTINLNAVNGLRRDPSSWVHVVIQFDSTQATGADREKIWVNGIEVGHDSNNNMTQNVGFRLNLNGSTEYMGINYWAASTAAFDGYLAEFNMVDGLTVAATEFGQWYNGVWVPKKYTGSYGTGGYYLDFSNAADLGEDQSGNNADWTAVGSPEQSLDTPTNNFCIVDELNLYSGTGTLSHAGLRVNEATGGSNTKFYSSFGAEAVNSLRKVYYECTSIANPTYGIAWIGITDGATDRALGSGGDTGYTTYGTYGCAIDFIEGKAWFRQTDGSWDGGGDPATGDTPTETFTPSTSYDLLLGAYRTSGQTAGGKAHYNFGASAFANAAPTGFNTVCTANLSSMSPPSIVDGETGLWITEWTGDASADRDITGASFNVSSNGLVWAKNKDSTTSHLWVDTVRGGGYHIYSNLTNANTLAADAIAGFLTNGFNVGDNAAINAVGVDYWATVLRMDSSFGMAITTYEGTGAAQTIPHTLGVAPSMIIVKNLDSAGSWYVYHQYADASTPEGYYLVLSGAAAARSSSATAWNNTAPTASVFSVGASATNTSGDTFIAYLFTDIPGFLKAGWYEGNNSTNGPRINFGFRPRWVMIKNIDSATNWLLIDTYRDPYNAADDYLVPNTNSANSSAVSGYTWDYLSNGLKIRGTGAAINGSYTYIYLAIADQAFPYSNAF